jgi:hypothetical protein
LGANEDEDSFLKAASPAQRQFDAGFASIKEENTRDGSFEEGYPHPPWHALRISHSRLPVLNRSHVFLGVL